MQAARNDFLGGWGQQRWHQRLTAAGRLLLFTGAATLTGGAGAEMCMACWISTGDLARGGAGAAARNLAFATDPFFAFGCADAEPDNKKKGESVMCV